MKNFKAILADARKAKEINAQERKLTQTDYPIDPILAIERMTGSGGGAKGVGLAGSFRALKETGIANGIQQLSGASAGAISMSLIAAGISAEEFRHLFTETNFKELMGEKTTKKGPGIIPLTKTGKPLYDMLNENIRKSISSFLATVQENDPVNNAQELQNIRAKLAVPEGKITFGDLEYLHRKWPKTFKSLTINATRHPSGEKQIFDAINTPDVEIALAARASGSLPLVLEPVPIKIGDKELLFVDGGLYDNLPTEYFDFDPETQTYSNKKQAQTLVLAFGEGNNNSTNPVFQALYGNSVAQVISEEAVRDIVVNAVNNCKKAKNFSVESVRKEIYVESLKTSRALVAYYSHNEGKTVVNEQEAKALAQVINQAADKVLANQATIKKIYEAKERGPNVLIEYLKASIAPVIYQASIFQKFLRNTIVRYVGGVDSPYNNTDQKEVGYQKLRADYALRTVELRVGDISTQDFKTATKYARVLDALGYLDTMKHIINYNLPVDPKDSLNQDEFFKTTVRNFLQIHKAVLAGSNSYGSVLVDQIIKIHKEDISPAQKDREMFECIKSFVEKHPGSAEAFALSRAVEYRSKIINSNDLFKEVYEEAFKRSSFFSQSKLTGMTIYSSRTLHEKMKEIKEMSGLQGINDPSTRSGKIHARLKEMSGFSLDKEQEPTITPVTELALKDNEGILPESEPLPSHRVP